MQNKSSFLSRTLFFFTINIQYASPRTPLHILLLIATMCGIGMPLYGQQTSLTAIQGSTDQGITLPQQTALLQRQDPGALQEILAFRGAISLGSWIDMQGTGTLTSMAFNPSGSNAPQNATLWLQAQAYRLDVQTSAGTSSMRIHGVYGMFLNAAGSQKQIDVRDALAEGNTFPVLMQGTFPVAGIMLIDQGLATVDGTALHRVTVEMPWPGNPVDANGNPLTTVTDFYFNPQTHLLAKSANAVLGSDPSPERFLQVITYGDYREVAGMQVPFQYQKTINGQLLWTLQLSQVQLNQGLTEADFTF